MQLFKPASQRLYAARLAGFSGFSGTIPFKVPTPDSRLTTSVSLLWWEFTSQSGVPFDITYGGSNSYALWLATRDKDDSGTGLYLPTNNLVGTRAAPVTIPTDVNIMGWGDDFSGGQDELYGELTMLATLGAGLRISLDVRYEATQAEICDEEWTEIVQMCTPSIVGGGAIG